jgi:tetratricopeptide (TPR) repeat protein
VGQARYQLARSEGRPEELHAARLSFEQVLIEHPEDVEVVRWLATLAYETGRYGEAVAYLQTARAQSPFEAADLERLGNCYLALGDSTRAMDYLDLAAQMRPPSPELAKTLGDLHVQARFPGRGAEWLARAYQQNPAQAPPEERFRIGVLFADGGRDEEAAAWLTAIGEAEPHHAESQARLVLIHQAAGREDDALAAHEQVRRLPGAFGLAHAAAGALYLKRKQLEPAADAYSRAAGLPESKVAGLVGLAEVSYARGNLEGALDYYRQALKFHPGDARLNAAVEQVAKEASIQGAKALSPTGSSGGQ